MRKVLLFTLISIFVVFSIFSVISIFKAQIVLNKTINIKKGTPTVQIGLILKEKGIIHSAELFVALTKVLNYDHKLHYGKFHFSGRYSILKVIRMLSHDEIVKYSVTIPEGYTVRKIANLLSKKQLVDYHRFVKLANDTTFIFSLQINAKTLEGFLFPDTYYIPYFANEEYIIKMMVNNFFLHLKVIQSEKISSDSLYSVLILASIVEREAIHDDERSLIAGVYKNRLANKMLLQADPTVAYALEQKGISREKIYYNDLKINSAYNTYIHRGLPPTPICNPGIKSILAALNPAKTDYFFFFAGRNSRHIFSTTYKEHLRKLKRI